MINLGTGRGHSVKQVIKITEEVVGKRLPVRSGPRRLGDLAKLLASNDQARLVLGWRPALSLEQMIKSAWDWEKA